MVNLPKSGGFYPPSSHLDFVGVDSTGLVKTSRSWGLDSTKPSWTSNDCIWLPWAMTCWCTFWECWDLLLPQEVMISHRIHGLSRKNINCRFHHILAPYGICFVNFGEVFMVETVETSWQQQMAQILTHFWPSTSSNGAWGAVSWPYPWTKAANGTQCQSLKSQYPSYFLCRIWCDLMFDASFMLKPPTLLL